MHPQPILAASERLAELVPLLRRRDLELIHLFAIDADRGKGVAVAVNQPLVMPIRPLAPRMIPFLEVGKPGGKNRALERRLPFFHPSHGIILRASGEFADVPGAPPAPRLFNAFRHRQWRGNFCGKTGRPR